MYFFKCIFIIVAVVFSEMAFSNEVDKESLFAGYSDSGEEKYLSVAYGDKKTLKDYITVLPGFFFDKCIVSQDYDEASIFEVKRYTTSNIATHFFIKILVKYSGDLGNKNVAIKIRERRNDGGTEYSLECNKG